MWIETAYAAGNPVVGGATAVNNMAVNIVAQIPYWIVGIVVLVGSIFLARMIASLATNMVQRSTEYASNHDDMLLLVHRMTMIVVVSMGIFVFFKIVGLVDSISWMMTALVAGIGFSMQGVLGNFLAGIAIILQNKIHLGDVVHVGNHMGKVTFIGSRATIIQTFDGYEVMIPNLDIVTQPVVIYTSHDLRRASVNVGVSYGSDISSAKSLIEQAVRSTDGVLPDQAIAVLVVGMGDNSVDLVAKFWFDQRENSAPAMSSSAYSAIKTVLDKAGIEIPFPQRTVHIVQENADVVVEENSQVDIDDGQNNIQDIQRETAASTAYSMAKIAELNEKAEQEETVASTSPEVVRQEGTTRITYVDGQAKSL